MASGSPDADPDAVAGERPDEHARRGPTRSANADAWSPSASQTKLAWLSGTVQPWRAQTGEQPGPLRRRSGRPAPAARVVARSDASAASWPTCETPNGVDAARIPAASRGRATA